jgi:hypothetical protein
MAKVRIHSPEASSSSSPRCRRCRMARRPSWRSRVGLLRPLALPLEEAVHRHDAAALAVGIPKGRQVPDGLALGVDRLSTTLRVIAPMRDQAQRNGSSDTSPV